jgi:hypothetical protein
MATPIPSTYREYCRLLHTVSTNLEALQRKKNKIVDTGMSYAAEPLPTGDIMDWEPATTVAAAART